MGKTRKRKRSNGRRGKFSWGGNGKMLPKAGRMGTIHLPRFKERKDEKKKAIRRGECFRKTSVTQEKNKGQKNSFPRKLGRRKRKCWRQGEERVGTLHSQRRVREGDEHLVRYNLSHLLHQYQIGRDVQGGGCRRGQSVRQGGESSKQGGRDVMALNAKSPKGVYTSHNARIKD